MSDEREHAWAGGGNWDDNAPPPEPEEPKRAPPPKPAAPATALPAPGEGAARGKSGLVCGRFSPLHRGHQLLIDYARQSVESLTVLVFTQANDVIPAVVRAHWIRTLFPTVSVAIVDDYPSPSAPDFAARFAHACRAWQPTGARVLFTSEESGRIAAEALGATLVYVDPARVIVPISGRKLREDLLGNFAFLTPPTRPAFVRRVAIIGAESTGKSTLCRWLADEYETQWAPEQARRIAAATGGLRDSEAICTAARHQLAREEELATEANRFLFCDTNALQLAAWHERLFGPAPPWLEARALDAYDLVLCCAPDLPFVGAPERDQPAARLQFDARVRARAGHGIVSIRGSFDERRDAARAAVERLGAARTFLAARAPALFQSIVSGKL